jgi:UDP-N-acetylmuramate--alanine ligase
VLVNLGYHVTGSDSFRGRHAAAERMSAGDARTRAESPPPTPSCFHPVKADNPEIVEAQRRKIPVIPQAEMLAEIADEVAPSPEPTARRRRRR